MAGTKVAYRAEAAPAPTRLERLRLPDFGEIIKYAGTIAAATTFALGGVGKAKAAEEYSSSGLSTQSEQALPRSTEDRPDDLAGRQIHVVYAVPSDGGNLNSDTDGSVNQILANVDNYAEGRGMPGMRWRWDLYQGQPDITRFMFNKTGAELSQMAEKPYAFLDYFNAETKKARLNNNPQKVYMGIYEGTAAMDSCNNGQIWPTEFIGGPAAQDNSTLNYLESGCLNRLTPSITSGLLSIIGLPSKNAPNSNKRGVIIDDIRDVQWKDSWRADWPYRNSMIDPGHDDYFMTGRPDDLSRVNYITWPLNVARKGIGDVSYIDGTVASGAVTSMEPDPGNRFPGGTQITLTAEGEFVSWGGDCAQETDNTCDLLMDRPHSVIANFKEAIKKVRVVRVAVKKKLGGGLVTGAGIRCPKDCSEPLQEGKELALIATPDKKSTAKWLKGCARKIGRKCIVSFASGNPEVLFAKR